MHGRLILAWAALALTVPAALQAQDARYPQRAVTLVVPSAPGGTTDFTARLVAGGLQRAPGLRGARPKRRAPRWSR